MRTVLFAIACFFYTSTGYAAVYDLPLNGTVTVSGDFANKVIFADIRLSASADIPDPPADQSLGNLSGFFVQTTVNGIEFDSGVTNQIGGGCHYPSCFGMPIMLAGYDINPSNWLNQLYISTSFYSFGDVRDPQIFLSVSLPDGYSIASPVPEPSTWALLLIGFACIYSFGRRSLRQAA